MLDLAGMKRAVVLSDAYYFDAPVHARALGDVGVHDVYAAVRAENDWTAREVAQFPHRLVGFCSFNPLKEYAPQELNRCAENLTFKGLKLHFSASAVDLTNKQHVERVRRIFAVANSHRLAITVHVRGDRRYGREHAEIFLNQLLPAAPDIPVQIAHLWGGDGFSGGAVAALVAYADAVSAQHRATKNLYFDVTQLALILRGQREALERMATLLRQIGVGRILYGSDGPMFGNVQPSEAWGAFRREMPLTGEEFISIANNIAPYVR
jgi:predicted TIM-barrel fold metal-dependent hydrolase